MLISESVSRMLCCGAVVFSAVNQQGLEKGSEQFRDSCLLILLTAQGAVEGARSHMKILSCRGDKLLSSTQACLFSFNLSCLIAARSDQGIRRGHLGVSLGLEARRLKIENLAKSSLHAVTLAGRHMTAVNFSLNPLQPSMQMSKAGLFLHE